MGSTSIFDIVGPVMIGPSSSHTAGMVKLGRLARSIYEQIFGNEPREAHIVLNKPLEKTYKGHGTYNALIAGLFLNCKLDDLHISNAYKIAKQREITIAEKPHLDEMKEEFGEGLHPNSVKFVFTEQEFYLVGSSIGGGRVKITNIKIPGKDEFEDLEMITGEYPTIVIFIEKDEVGIINLVSSLLGHDKVNISSMRYHRKVRGGNALWEGWLEKEGEEVPMAGISKRLKDQVETKSHLLIAPI